jgi:hypothetical protein
MDFDRFPGGALIRQGLDDLAAGRESDEALLVLVGSPRLRSLGIAVPIRNVEAVEHLLYERLARANPDGAHSRYNALIRTLVSFERAVACAT